MSVELLGFDTSGRRGIRTEADKVLARSTGVVIGVGGSGIQTISRVRSAIQADRPDAAATPTIEFLGIDAVDLSKQNPPLPPGVNLDARQMYNLTENPFDASEYVRLVGGGDTTLSQWWDMSQRVPVGPLIDGLKQNRMLGRLAFYRESQTLASKIQYALSQSVRVTQELVEQGVLDPQGGIAPKVFIVSSSCGGTGSAGLLEVLHKTWVAARALNMTPEIRVFTYLPGVFQSAVLESSAMAGAEMGNMQANAFAFFRELDHFIVKSDELHASVCNPTATQNPQIPAGQLVKQVFAVDATLNGAGRLSRVTDAYEIAAEAIYQFLMTDAGRPQIAQNGTNTDTYLQGTDSHGQRRIYCGIGIASVTYPGDTYRRHLVHRFAEWLISQHLVARPVDLESQAHKHALTASLVSDLSRLHSSVASYELPPKALELQMLAETASEVLVDEHTEDIVSRVLTAFTNTAPAAVGQLQSQLRMAKDVALNQLEAVVVDAVLAAGKGAPFAAEMVRRGEKSLRDLRTEAAESRAMYQEASPRAQRETEDCRRKLRGLMERALVMPKAREKAAESLGRAVQAWGADIIGEHRADGEVRFLDAAILRLSDMRAELEAAGQSLEQQGTGFREVWHADILIGKDAGPVDTTALIPEDAQPEVEDSALAVQAFKEVLNAMEAVDMDDYIRDLYERWRKSTAGGTLFGLGSANPDLRKKAERAFLGEVRALADTKVLQIGDAAEGADPDAATKRLILPRTLLDAADRADAGKSLERGLMSLVGLSRKACWAWNAARLGPLAAEGKPEPSPATVIVRPKSLTDHVARHFQPGGGLTIIEGADEERIVAMTTEWGVSAHALQAAATWEEIYNRAVASVSVDPNQQRPHLDRTWAARLKPLVPLYYDRDLVVTTIAKILTATRLLREEDVAESVFGPNLHNVRGHALFAQQDHGDRISITGTVFTDDPTNASYVVRRDITLGSNYSELITAVGDSAEYRQSSLAVVESVLRAAGRPRAIDTIQALIDNTFKPLESSGLRNHAEGEAVTDITVALAELQSVYRQAELQAGTLG